MAYWPWQGSDNPDRDARKAAFVRDAPGTNTASSFTREWNQSFGEAFDLAEWDDELQED